MEIQHFNSFKLSLQEHDLEKFISLEDDLPNVTDGDKKKFMAEHNNESIKKYEEFAQETKDGNHGKTAQYWMGSVDMLHLYHEFSRSIRTGDLDLYIYCLQQMTALFFTFNHQNYSRWLTVYHDKLLKLKNSHCDIYEELKNGCFSLKQTSKPFSRILIDLTLEQTINSLKPHKYCVKIIWGAGNDKQGRYLRRVQVAPSETKLPSLGENNFIYQRYHESFWVNHWERASFQYSQWESSTRWNSRLFNQRLDYWFQLTWLFHQRLQW